MSAVERYPQSSTLPRAGERLGIRDPWILLGVALYALHYYVEGFAPIKLSEWALLACAIVWASPGRFSPQNRRALWAAATLYALVAWLGFTDAYAGAPAGAIVKTVARFGVLFGTILLFIVSDHQRRLFNIVVGLVLAIWIRFLLTFGLEFLGFETGYIFAGEMPPPDSVNLVPRNSLIKWVIPFPPAILLVAVTIWRRMTRPFRLAWCIVVATTLGAAVVVDSRLTAAAFLCGGLGLLTYWLCSLYMRARFVDRLTTVAAALVPVAPIAATLLVSSHEIALSEMGSPSNVERLFLIEVALDALADAPVVGWGSREFFWLYGPDFEYLFALPAAVDNPHNLVLDVGVAGGLPAVVLLLLLHTQLTRASLGVEGSKGSRVFAIYAVSMIYALVPMAWDMRFFVIALWFMALGVRTDYRGPTDVRLKIDPCAARGDGVGVVK